MEHVITIVRLCSSTNLTKKTGIQHRKQTIIEADIELPTSLTSTYRNYQLHIFEAWTNLLKNCVSKKPFPQEPYTCKKTVFKCCQIDQEPILSFSSNMTSLLKCILYSTYLGDSVAVALVERALLGDLGELHVHLLRQHRDGIPAQPCRRKSLKLRWQCHEILGRHLMWNEMSWPDKIARCFLCMLSDPYLIFILFLISTSKIAEPTRATLKIQ